ncbi:hypothetical protein JMJ35_010668 [Cladonia borealis]|uniref:Heterokaryon incompatibility domain-containing protein n=1 Tax=Cladonia borealis TaxID=184061 RepID=A0AA39UX04_9LECA|nr:hypothetical protein JMJ35_010668 [Cladonia borealis]
MLSSLESVTGTQFRVVKFEFCHDSECTFSTNPHLIVTTDYVELKRSKAIALSYTWGEFDRKRRCIGHRPDNTPVELQLGAEWIIEDVVARLAMLCIKHGLCWVDQFCIPQRDEEVRTALASIPMIYKTLDVIALLPGSLCACAGRVAWTSDQVAPCVKNPVAKERLEAQLRGTLTRIRSGGASTEHSGENLTNRPLDNEAVNNLSPYALKLYEQCLAEGGDPLMALMELHLEQIRFTERAVSSFSEFLDVDRFDSTSELRAFITFIKFLNGMVAVKDVSYDAETDTDKRLKGFFTQIGRLGSLQRAATQQRDYVAAVWVDCPGYILPIRLENMSLSELLEDTLNQIEKKFGLSFTVCAPSGLFGASQRGALWQPSQYLDHIETNTARDVYGVLPRSRNGPIKLDKNSHVSLQHLGAGEFMKKVIRNWPGDVTERLFYSQKNAKRDYAKTTVDHFCDLLLLYTVTERNVVDMQHPTRQLQTMLTSVISESEISLAEHYNATYSFVADALGLDRSFCQSLGLQLMVGFFPSPCISLSAVDLDMTMEVDVDDFHYDDEVWTVCMSRGAAASGSLLIEVEKVLEQAEPRQFRVTGVWVPCVNVRLNEISAIPSIHGRDGFII